MLVKETIQPETPKPESPKPVMSQAMSPKAESPKIESPKSIKSEKAPAIETEKKNDLELSSAKEEIKPISTLASPKENERDIKPTADKSDKSPVLSPVVEEAPKEKEFENQTGSILIENTPSPQGIKTALSPEQIVSSAVELNPITPAQEEIVEQPKPEKSAELPIRNDGEDINSAIVLDDQEIDGLEGR